MSKICTKCNLDLSETSYTADKRNKDGLQSSCNECRKKQKKEFRDRIRQGIGVKIITEKTCTGCKETKLITEFFKSASLSDGYHTQCKICKNKTVAQWRAKKKEHYNSYMKEFRKTHPEKYELARNRGLMHRYGISSEQYEQLFKQQEGLCAICKKTCSKKLVIDHNHITKQIRGLLCTGCNVAIAILDNPELLQQAQKYLKVLDDTGIYR